LHGSLKDEKTVTLKLELSKGRTKIDKIKRLKGMKERGMCCNYE